MKTKHILIFSIVIAVIVGGIGASLKNTSAGLNYCDILYGSCYELIEYQQDSNSKNLIENSIEIIPSIQYLETLSCKEILEYDADKTVFSADMQEFFKEKISVCNSKKSENPETPEIFSHGITKYVNPNHESLKYYKTPQVIDETFLGKNVQQWQDAWDWELQANYDIYKDEFYEGLGGLLVKNEITRVINQVGITNVHDDFTVHQGYSLLSLPPHIGFTAVIIATDGNSYLIEATSHSNRVNYYSITQLRFFDTTDELSLEEILNYPQTIHILPEDGHKSRSEPSDLIIHTDNGSVNFVNRTPEVIRIQESGTGKIEDEHELAWIGPIIPAFGNDSVMFDKPGYYEWNAKTAPTLENPLWWDSHASGDVIVLADDIDELPLKEKLRMGRTILANSEIPFAGMGVGNADNALKVSLRPAVYDMLPDAVSYYQDRAEQLIPFDIPIIFEDT